MRAFGSIGFHIEPTLCRYIGGSKSGLPLLKWALEIMRGRPEKWPKSLQRAEKASADVLGKELFFYLNHPIRRAASLPRANASWTAVT